MVTQLRFALRSLLKTPGFTLVAVLIIAVALGANTALVSIFNRLVLHPLDLPQAGRLVRLWTNNQGRNLQAPIVSVPKYELYRDQQTAFASIAAATPASFILTRPGVDPEQLNSLLVTASFVPTLGLSLAQGRNFTPEEDTPNGPAVCLLGYEVWKTRFGRRDSLVGETITLDGASWQVVGILPEKLPAPLASIQLLAPRPLAPPAFTSSQIQNGAGFLEVTARLKPGIGFDEAATEVRTLAARYALAYPGKVDASAENELRTWEEELVGPVRSTLSLLLAAVGLVLLIACANVSSLFLGRLTARHREIAIRLSLGATRRELITQFLTETLVFCAAAGGLGILLARWALDTLQHTLAAQLPAGTTFALDGPALGFCLGVTALVALAIGLVPAFQASRVNLSEVLKDTARSMPGGRRGKRLRSALIVAEVAFSTVLLVGAGLIFTSFLNLQSTPPGFKPDGVASAFVILPSARYPTKTAQSDFYYRVMERLRTYPQVRHAAAALSPPISGDNPQAVYVLEGQPIPPLAERAIASLNFVSEDYFALFQIPLVSGRRLTADDREKASPVCLVNESFARRLSPQASVLGQQLLRGGKADIKLEIVGVVADVKSTGLNATAPDTMYLPLRQWGGLGLSLLASTEGDPQILQSLLRTAVAEVDRTEAISQFSTLDAALRQSLGIQRITAWLTGAFAGVALVLSAVGLYSVLAYAVTLRTGEIGLRMAVGAARSQVVTLVLAQAMKLVALGLGLGLAIAAVATRLIRALLYQIEPLDPLVFGGVAVLFLLVAVIAGLVPSWRAAHVDPLVALRSE